MPKFFGGDETKQAACEGAIIDTIKKWSKAVWEWIKSLYAKMKKAIQWLLGMWVHDSRPKGEVIKTYEKAVSMMQNSTDPQVRAQFDLCFSDLSMYDPKVLGTWIESYSCLSDTLSEIVADIDKLVSIDEYERVLAQMFGKTVDTLTPEEKLAAAYPHIKSPVLQVLRECNDDFSMVVFRYWGEHPTNPIRNHPPTKTHNGFEFTRTGGGPRTAGVEFGKVFTDDDNFPKYSMGYSDLKADKAARDLYISQMSDACEKAGNLLNKVKDLHDGKMKNIVERRCKKANDYLTDPKKDENSAEALFARLQMNMCQACLSVEHKLLLQAGSIANNLNREQKTFLTRIAEFKKNISGSATY